MKRGQELRFYYKTDFAQIPDPELVNDVGQSVDLSGPQYPHLKNVGHESVMRIKWEKEYEVLSIVLNTVNHNPNIYHYCYHGHRHHHHRCLRSHGLLVTLILPKLMLPHIYLGLFL